MQQLTKPHNIHLLLQKINSSEERSLKSNPLPNIRALLKKNKFLALSPKDISLPIHQFSHKKSPISSLSTDPSLSIDRCSKTIIRPYKLNSRRDMNKEAFSQIVHCHVHKATREEFFDLGKGFLERREEDFVKKHQKGFEDIENQDFFKHFFRIYFKDQASLSAYGYFKGKKEVYDNKYEIEGLLNKGKSDKGKIEGSFVKGKEFPFVLDIEMKEFLVKRTRLDMKLFESILKLGPEPLKTPIKAEKGISEVNSKLETPLKERFFREDVFLTNLLEKVQKNGVSSLGMAEFENLKEVLWNRKLLLEQLEIGIIAEGLKALKSEEKKPLSKEQRTLFIKEQGIPMINESSERVSMRNEVLEGVFSPRKGALIKSSFSLNLKRGASCFQKGVSNEEIKGFEAKKAPLYKRTSVLDEKAFKKLLKETYNRNKMILKSIKEEKIGFLDEKYEEIGFFDEDSGFSLSEEEINEKEQLFEVEDNDILIKKEKFDKYNGNTHFPYEKTYKNTLKLPYNPLKYDNLEEKQINDKKSLISITNPNPNPYKVLISPKITHKKLLTNEIPLKKQENPLILFKGPSLKDLTHNKTPSKSPSFIENKTLDLKKREITANLYIKQKDLNPEKRKPSLLMKKSYKQGNNIEEPHQETNITEVIRPSNDNSNKTPKPFKIHDKQPLKNFIKSSESFNKALEKEASSSKFSFEREDPNLLELKEKNPSISRPHKKTSLKTPLEKNQSLKRAHKIKSLKNSLETHETYKPLQKPSKLLQNPNENASNSFEALSFKEGETSLKPPLKTNQKQKKAFSKARLSQRMSLLSKVNINRGSLSIEVKDFPSEDTKKNIKESLYSGAEQKALKKGASFGLESIKVLGDTSKNGFLEGQDGDISIDLDRELERIEFTKYNDDLKENGNDYNSSQRKIHINSPNKNSNNNNNQTNDINNKSLYLKKSTKKPVIEEDDEEAKYNNMEIEEDPELKLSFEKNLKLDLDPKSNEKPQIPSIRKKLIHDRDSFDKSPSSKSHSHRDSLIRDNKPTILQSVGLFESYASKASLQGKESEVLKQRNSISLFTNKESPSASPVKKSNDTKRKNGGNESPFKSKFNVFEEGEEWGLEELDLKGLKQRIEGSMNERNADARYTMFIYNQRKEQINMFLQQIEGNIEDNIMSENDCNEQLKQFFEMQTRFNKENDKNQSSKGLKFSSQITGTSQENMVEEKNGQNIESLAIDYLNMNYKASWDQDLLSEKERRKMFLTQQKMLAILRKFLNNQRSLVKQRPFSNRVIVDDFSDNLVEVTRFDEKKSKKIVEILKKDNMNTFKRNYGKYCNSLRKLKENDKVEFENLIGKMKGIKGRVNIGKHIY